ncbi:hypothetical protein MCETRH20_01565 [Methylophilaceae bacterium]
MRAIAVRGFINEKFNSTFGKSLFRRAFFNGSVELRNPNSKYLVDYYQYAEWAALAKSDEQMQALAQLQNSGFSTNEGLLFSWLVRYDPLTKVKTKVDGYSIYAPNTSELYITINDPAHQTVDEWTLDVHLCKNAGAHKPVFIAANIDLNQAA